MSTDIRDKDYTTNNNEYYFEICSYCNENDVNAYYSCQTAKYCEDCITKLDNCPICEKPEDISILSFSNYKRTLNIRTVRVEDLRSKLTINGLPLLPDL